MSITMFSTMSITMSGTKSYRSIVDVDTGDAMYVVYNQQEKTDIRYHFKGTTNDSKQADRSAGGLKQDNITSSMADSTSGRLADTIELYYIDYPTEYWYTTITNREIIFVVNRTMHGELFIALHKSMYLDGKSATLDNKTPSLADYSFLIQYGRSTGCIDSYLVHGKKLTQVIVPKAAAKMIQKIASEKIRYDVPIYKF